MAKKKKSKLKKALLAGAALAGGLALARGRRHAGVRDSDDAGRGVNWYGHRMDNIPFADHTTVNPDFSLGASAAKGGRIGAKHGGRVKSMGAAKRGGGVAKR